MNLKTRKVLIYILILFLVAICFYKFMTYDRNYTWSKEFNEEVNSISKESNFKFYKEDKIDVRYIKLPIEIMVKTKFQNLLNKVNLMNYGEEYGSLIILKPDNSNEILKFKGFCLDDHLIGLEIEYKNIDEGVFYELKKKIERQFDNYKIVWTKL